MKKSILWVAISILCLITFFYLIRLFENPCHGFRGKTITRSFYSLSVKDYFKVVVYLPKDYEKKLSKKYPVIYQLDGSYFGKTTAIFTSYLACTGKIPSEVIVVGIGYFYDSWFDKRERDYLAIESVLTGTESRNIGHGGVHFFNFLKSELIPFIDEQYRTISLPTGRTLMGHSLGGYFTLFTLFYQYYLIDVNKPVNNNSLLFSNFISASPVVVNGWRYIFILEDKLKKRKFESFPIGLFISMSDIEEKTRYKYFPALSQRIERWKFPGFRSKISVLHKLQTPDTAIPSFLEGIKFIFMDTTKP